MALSGGAQFVRHRGEKLVLGAAGLFGPQSGAGDFRFGFDALGGIAPGRDHPVAELGDTHVKPTLVSLAAVVPASDHEAIG